MKTGGILLILILIAFNFICFQEKSEAGWHRGDSSICSDCHTVHYNEDEKNAAESAGPFSYLLTHSTINGLCLGCHDGKFRNVPDIMYPVSAQVKGSDGDEFTGAGYFSTTGVHSANAHDLGVMSMVPMSHPQKNMVLSCATCHDVHGNDNYRNLISDPDSSGAGVSLIVNRDVFIGAPENPGSSDRYLASNTGYKMNYSLWCAECHNLLKPETRAAMNFEGHPSDKGISDISPMPGRENFKNSDSSIKHWLNGSGDGFGSIQGDESEGVPRVRFQEPSAHNFESAKAVSPSNQVFCGTCHLAHGGKYKACATWSYNVAGADMYSPCQQCHNKSSFAQSPHGDPESGVLLHSSYPRGHCLQCHIPHDPAHGTGSSSNTQVLPVPLSTNATCFVSDGASPCHANTPARYPAQEKDRMPEDIASNPGYFEYNAAGVKINGVENRVRWTGKIVYENPGFWAPGKYFSPHRNDPDMPVKDSAGNGSCMNCHDPHGSAASPLDMLNDTYTSIFNSRLGGARPSNYEICFDCHNKLGPPSMEPENKNIADYYDNSVNADRESGHQIRIATSGYTAAGDKLPCYDCHNPHGSRGSDGINPNSFLISDQRPGWYGLTNIQYDNSQVRRFCFGCHISSDNQGGGEVERMVLKPLPSNVSAHSFSAGTHCYDCHGRDYSSPDSRNVHHPDPGNSSAMTKRIFP